MYIYIYIYECIHVVYIGRERFATYVLSCLLRHTLIGRESLQHMLICPYLANIELIISLIGRESLPLVICSIIIVMIMIMMSIMISDIYIYCLVRVCVCVYIYIYIYMYVCIYIYIYIYMHKYILRLQHMLICPYLAKWVRHWQSSSSFARVSRSIV